jgi:hypothetical protein
MKFLSVVPAIWACTEMYLSDFRHLESVYNSVTYMQSDIFQEHICL